MSPSTEQPHLAVERTPERTVVRLVGWKTLHDQNTPLLQGQLFALLAEMGGVPLVLDLGDVTYLTSTTLGMLIGLHKKLRASGGSLTVAGVRDELYEVFEATRLHQLFEVRRQEPAGPAPA